MEKQFECTKIKDGLYLGNKMVAFDLEFLVINKFAYVINCASEVPNLFEQHGIKYVKFKIKQDKNQQIFDEEYKRLKKMKKIMSEVEESGLCCLIHCNQSYNRSLVILIAYLMDRFRWRLRKTLQFLQAKGVSIILTDSNIEELTNFQYVLSREHKLSQQWTGPFLDQQEELLTRTFNNTPKKQIQEKQTKPKTSAIKQHIKEEVVQVKSTKRVQWQDRIEKEQKKEKKRLLADKSKEQKMQNQRMQQKPVKQIASKKQVKAKMSIGSKEKSQGSKTSKKKLISNAEMGGKKRMNEAEIMKLLKKSSKCKQETTQNEEWKSANDKPIERDSVNEEELSQKAEQQVTDSKKVYKLTINNYINPNINIIKPPLDKKKKLKGTTKKEKDKFNRTYSEKEAFKKPTFFNNDTSKGKDTSTEKRNSGHTPLRSRKERKSDKQKI